MYQPAPNPTKVTMNTAIIISIVLFPAGLVEIVFVIGGEMGEQNRSLICSPMTSPLET